jgi:hypothetical protein
VLLVTQATVNFLRAFSVRMPKKLMTAVLAPCVKTEMENLNMNFEKKIAVIIREDLLTWQKLNVTAFLSSGFGTQDVMGENYEDASGKIYLPMCGHPILVYSARGEELQEILNKAVTREIDISIYNEEMFSTGNDIDNRACIKKYPTDRIADIVGLGLCGKKQHIDKTLKGYKLHI